MPPASLRRVGRKQVFPETAGNTVRAAVLPGHHARDGWRTPPSRVLHFPPRNGPAVPPSLPFTSHGPLSLLNITSVFSASFSSRSVSNTRPVLQSTSSTQSP